MVTRYAKRPAIWCVTSGVHVNRVARLTDDQMIDLTRRVSVLVRQADRNARIWSNWSNPSTTTSPPVRDRFPGSATRPAPSTRACMSIASGCGFGVVSPPTEVRPETCSPTAMRWIDRSSRTTFLLTGFSARLRFRAWFGSWRQPWCEHQRALWAASMIDRAWKTDPSGRGQAFTAQWRLRGCLVGGLHDCPVEGSIGLLDEDGSPRRCSPSWRRSACLRSPLRSSPGPYGEAGQHRLLRPVDPGFCLVWWGEPIGALVISGRRPGPT